MKLMTTEAMINKATASGGYFIFHTISVSQRDCDTATGARLPETANDFFFRRMIISRQEAEIKLKEICE